MSELFPVQSESFEDRMTGAREALAAGPDAIVEWILDDPKFEDPENPTDSAVTPTEEI